MKTKKQIQKKIQDWVIKTESEECVITESEDDNKKEFLFKYDGFIYEILWEGNYPCFFKEFEDLFKNTGWCFDFALPSIMLVFREDR